MSTIPPAVPFPPPPPPPLGPAGGPYPPHLLLLDPARRRARRVGTVGFIVGGVGFVLALALVLATDLIPSAAAGFGKAPVLAAAVVLVTAGAMVLYLLMAISGSRLAAGARAGPLDAVAGRLRRSRYAAGPLFLVELLLIGLGVVDEMPWSGVAGLLAFGCAAGCGFLVLDARRAEDEVDWARGGTGKAGGRAGGATRPRAFEVLMPGQPGPTGPTQDLPGRAVGGIAGGPAAAVQDGVGPADGWDWEWMLLGVVLFAVAWYVIRLPDLFFHLKDYARLSAWGDLVSMATGSATPSPYSSPRTIGGWYYGPGQRPWVPLAYALGRVGGEVLALAWVAWGAVCLTAGPRGRRAAWGLVLAGLSLYAFTLLAAAFQAPQRPFDPSRTVTAGWSNQTTGAYGRSGGYGYSGYSRYGYGGGYIQASYLARLAERLDDDEVGDLRSYGLRLRTLDLVFPVLLLFLLTRPPVRALFDRRRTGA